MAPWARRQRVARGTAPGGSRVGKFAAAGDPDLHRVHWRRGPGPVRSPAVAPEVSLPGSGSRGPDRRRGGPRGIRSVPFPARLGRHRVVPALRKPGSWSLRGGIDPDA